MARGGSSSYRRASRHAMPKLALRHAAACGLAFLVSLGLVGSGVHVPPDAVPDDADRFPFVVAIEADGRLICSGTVLYRRLVVTAAHCLQQLMIVRGMRFYVNDYVRPEALSVRVVQGGAVTSYAVAEVAISPGWLASGTSQQSSARLPYDLALLVTQEPIDVTLPGSGLAEGAALTPSSPAGPGGHRGVLVAFGGTKCLRSGRCPDAGVRRFVRVAIKDGSVCFKSRLDRQAGLPHTVWCTDSLVLPGDSGGALLVEASDGTLQYVGVISAQRGLPPEFHSLASWQQSAAAALAPNRDFILDTARALGDALSSDP